MTIRLRHRMAAIGVATLALTLLNQSGAQAFTPKPFSPLVEAQNFLKVEERQTIYDTPGYQVLLRTRSLENATAALAEQINDPGRMFAASLCRSGDDGCAGGATRGRWRAAGCPSRCISRRAAGPRSPATSGRHARAPPIVPASSSRTDPCRPMSSCTGSQPR